MHPTSRTKVICLAVLMGLLNESAAFAERREDRPNIVVFLSDDQGWGDFSFVGNPNLSTPHIDSLAKDGILFENFFVCPVCSPTRAEFLTGRYHVRSGIRGTGGLGNERLDLDEWTIADALKAAGYQTAAMGKWHNGTQAPYHPNSRGFDYFYGFCSGHWGNYFSPVLEENGEIVRGQGFVTDDFTSRAMEFIEANQKKPFFVYLPYNTPHSPMQVPDRYWNRFKDKAIQPADRGAEKEKLAHTRAALAMCENIDWNVGRVLQQLTDLKLADKTIVVYFCDNGPNGWRWNGGLKGTKGSTDEGGVRSPLLMRFPGQFDVGKRITTLAGAIDLHPTLLDLAGVGHDGPNEFDGTSLVNLIDEEAGSSKLTNWPNRKLFSHWRGRVSVRTDQFRLDHDGQLFDIVTDPGQRTTVNELQPRVANELRHDVEKWRNEILSELDATTPRPFTIGHGSLAVTQLPARDATATGAIRRSNRFPNCSYFTSWANTADTISWPVDVLTSANYEVELYCTCAPENVGARVELSGCGGSVSKEINVPYDRSPKGGKNDRYARQESYVKDFRPTKLGTIQLNQGLGQLVLKSVKIPGDESIEFRLLTLRRISK